MTRQPFPERCIRLVSQLQVDTAKALLDNVPRDPVKPLLLRIGEEPKRRGLDQNGLYWLRLGEIAEQAWIEGKQYSKEVLHEYARHNLMPEVVTNKDGHEVSKWVESPDGRPVVISTTQLEKRCFAQYTEIVEAFGASLGVAFSVNPREV